MSASPIRARLECAFSGGGGAAAPASDDRLICPGFVTRAARGRTSRGAAAADDAARRNGSTTWTRCSGGCRGEVSERATSRRVASRRSKSRETSLCRRDAQSTPTTIARSRPSPATNRRNVTHGDVHASPPNRDYRINRVRNVRLQTLNEPLTIIFTCRQLVVTIIQIIHTKQIQEAFEKCWAHSPLRAVLLCHSPAVATVARRLRIDVHDNDDDNNNNDNA